MRRTQTFSVERWREIYARWLAERRDVLDGIDAAVHDVDSAFTGVIVELR